MTAAETRRHATSGLHVTLPGMDDFRRAVAILRASGEDHAAEVLERIEHDENLVVLLRDSWWATLPATAGPGTSDARGASERRDVGDVATEFPDVEQERHAGATGDAVRALRT